jgi:hypothetical protein
VHVTVICLSDVIRTQLFPSVICWEGEGAQPSRTEHTLGGRVISDATDQTAEKAESEERPGTESAAVDLGQTCINAPIYACFMRIPTSHSSLFSATVIL